MKRILTVFCSILAGVGIGVGVTYVGGIIPSDTTAESDRDEEKREHNDAESGDCTDADTAHGAKDLRHKDHDGRDHDNADSNDAQGQVIGRPIDRFRSRADALA